MTYEDMQIIKTDAMMEAAVSGYSWKQLTNSQKEFWVSREMKKRNIRKYK